MLSEHTNHAQLPVKCHLLHAAYSRSRSALLRLHLGDCRPALERMAPENLDIHTTPEDSSCRRVAKLVMANMQTEEFARYPGHAFLNRDCIETLHRILDIKVRSSVCRQPALIVFIETIIHWSRRDKSPQRLAYWPESKVRSPAPLTSMRPHLRFPARFCLCA